MGLPFAAASLDFRDSRQAGKQGLHMQLDSPQSLLNNEPRQGQEK